MQVDILAFQALPYFYAALSRSDLWYVAGEFRIFGAIFLEDGCSLFNVTSTSLSSARYSIARFSTLSGVGFLNGEVFNFCLKGEGPLVCRGQAFSGQHSSGRV